MTYEVDQYYIFPVQSGNPSDDSFSLEVDGPEGRATVKLAKLEFQKSPEYVQPLELRCRVKSFDDEDGITPSALRLPGRTVTPTSP